MQLIYLQINFQSSHNHCLILIYYYIILYILIQIILLILFIHQNFLTNLIICKTINKFSFCLQTNLALQFSQLFLYQFTFRYSPDSNMISHYIIFIQRNADNKPILFHENLNLLKSWNIFLICILFLDGVLQQFNKLKYMCHQSLCNSNIEIIPNPTKQIEAKGKQQIILPVNQLRHKQQLKTYKIIQLYCPLNIQLYYSKIFCFIVTQIRFQKELDFLSLCNDLKSQQLKILVYVIAELLFYKFLWDILNKLALIIHEQQPVSSDRDKC
ncbi:hypothetical protein pb186bvf_010140 [Paramecium bursaria]